VSRIRGMEKCFGVNGRDEIKGLMGDGNVSARSAPTVYLVRVRRGGYIRGGGMDFMYSIDQY